MEVLMERYPALEQSRGAVTATAELLIKAYRQGARYWCAATEEAVRIWPISWGS